MDTRQAMRAEFMRMHARQSMNRITVKALCAAVPVARTTFYAHYRNVDEVLAEIEDDLLGGISELTERVSKGDLATMDFHAFLGELFEYIQSRGRLPRTDRRPAGRAPRRALEGQRKGQLLAAPSQGAHEHELGAGRRDCGLRRHGGVRI